MRLDRVDLNLFVVFDALYRERSVTRVATHLNLTQPAVSNALSRLRQTFEDPLFVRSPDGMAPTPVADSVVADVKEALALLSRSVAVNAHFDPVRAEKVFWHFNPLDFRIGAWCGVLSLLILGMMSVKKIGKWRFQ